MVKAQLFHDGGRYLIETSPLIHSANQSTGFYIISVSVMKELNASVEHALWLKHKSIVSKMFENLVGVSKSWDPCDTKCHCTKSFPLRISSVNERILMQNFIFSAVHENNPYETPNGGITL